MAKASIRRSGDRVYSYVGKCRACGSECTYQGKRSMCKACLQVARTALPPKPKKTKPKAEPTNFCVCGKPTKKEFCRACYLGYATKHPKMKNCLTCGSEFSTRVWNGTEWRHRPDRLYCSQSCARKQAASRRIYSMVCKYCGVSCEATVCTSCRKKVADQTARRNRNLRRGARVAGPYDRREIADRDGWLCHLCGGSVAKHLWSSNRYNSNAPVLDHVIPIARGGLDIASNVKLAHWSCNNKKSDKLPGEERRPKRSRREGDPQAA